MVMSPRPLQVGWYTIQSSIQLEIEVAFHLSDEKSQSRDRSTSREQGFQAALFVFKEDRGVFYQARALVSFDRDWDRSASREQGFSFAHESSAFQSHFIVMSTSPSLNLFDNKVGTNRRPASKPDSTDRFSTATLNRPSLDDNHSAGVVLLPTWLCTIQSSEDDSVMMRFFTPGGTEE
ncbi:hypothetical protein C8Q75DRAFT_732534 [Abortiporus biennis]|nr:hypothetical protein C8Q75DRAFT_732534 [Abortiporus biennis]